MTKADSSLKRYKTDRIVGLGLMGYALLFAYPCRDDIVALVVMTISGILGYCMWAPSETDEKLLYSMYKIDLSILFLLEKTNGSISVDHCYQIIKNTNITLENKFIPIIELFKGGDYTHYLKSSVSQHYDKITMPMTDDDVSWLRNYLEPSKDFLKEDEKKVLMDKLKFYIYQ